jgi:hypothetical protein
MKACQANAFHLISDREILNNLIDCISWHTYLLFLSPRTFSFFRKDLNFISKSFPIQFKSLPFKSQFEFEYSNQFSKLFKFITSLLQFKFGLNEFESLTFILKSLFEKIGKIVSVARLHFGPHPPCGPRSLSLELAHSTWPFGPSWPTHAPPPFFFLQPEPPSLPVHTTSPCRTASLATLLQPEEDEPKR